jgi:hypothetical protein
MTDWGISFFWAFIDEHSLIRYYGVRKEDVAQ